MSAGKVLGLILIIGGFLALIYGGFTYTRRSGSADVGPVHVSVAHRETVAVPLWAGIGAIVVGGLVLAMDGRRR